MAYKEPVNLTGIDGLFNYADDVSGGWFYIMLPISLYIILFIYLKGRGFETSKCFIASGFLTSLVSAVLFFLGGLSSEILFTFIVLTFIPAIWSMWKD